jgi:quinol monooxygenase YgiN
MPSTVHVVARFTAKAGKEQALRTVLGALVAPTRRELGCYQFDLLENPLDARDFCFVERWEHDKSVDEHAESAHVRQVLKDVEGLVESPPDIRRYRQV